MNLLYKRTFQTFRASTTLLKRYFATKSTHLCFNENMKLDSPEFRSLFTPELDVILSLFKKYGYELRIAGGAVRDLLLGVLPADVDFATTATPDQMIDMFDKEYIRMLNKKGEKHGTITCRINDKENFEITTLRIDKLCDGRHAEVEFTTDWVKDANRRDLTINSLFLGFDGTVYDYFGGVKDLENRRMAFVGKAEERIQEDYLRILRYFRFYGRFALQPNNHENETIQAIKSNVQGLAGISGERLWVELKKIVNGRFAGPVVRTMLECGIGPHVGLPVNSNIDEFEKVWNRCKNMNPKPITTLSALFNTPEEFDELVKRLKLSNKEKLLGFYILLLRNQIDLNSIDDRSKYFRGLAIDRLNPGKSIEGNDDDVHELAKYFGFEDTLVDLTNWQIPKFPVNGGMLISKGVRKGPAMKIVLGKLFDTWKNSNFTITAEQLLNNIEDAYLRDRSRSKSPNNVKL